MSGFKPPNFGGGLDPDQEDAVDSIINLADNTIPQVIGGELLTSGAKFIEGSGAVRNKIVFDEEIQIPSNSLLIGPDLTLSEGSSTLIGIDNVNGITREYIHSAFNTSGSSRADYFKKVAQENVILQPDDSQNLTANPLDFQVTSSNESQINSIYFRAGSVMTNVRIRITDNSSGVVLRYLPNKAAWDSQSNGFDFIVGDNELDLLSTALSTPGVINVGVSPLRFNTSQVIDVSIESDTVDLLGNIGGIPFLNTDEQDGVDTALVEQESELEVTGVTFVNADGQLLTDVSNFNYDNTTNTLNVINLTVDGVLSTVDTENLIVTDSHIGLNSGYVTTSPKEGGLVVTYLPTATAATVTTGAFVAGVDAVSNPTVSTVAASGLAQGDIVQVSGSSENNGIFEVEDHSSNLLTIRGVGTISTVESFTGNQFTANASDNATITKVNVSVIQSDSSGAWEQGVGSVTPITFSDLGGGNGDVVGPVTSTDNGIATWDGTGGDQLQSTSRVTIETSPDTVLSIEAPHVDDMAEIRIKDVVGDTEILLQFDGDAAVGQQHHLTFTDHGIISTDGGNLTLDGALAISLQAEDNVDLLPGAGDNVVAGLSGDGQLLVTGSGHADTAAIMQWETTGTNAGLINLYIGSRDPEGNVTANPGDLYFRDDSGADAGIFVKRASSTTGWAELGDLSGPASATDDSFALFDGTTGKLTKSSGAQMVVNIDPDDVEIVVEASATGEAGFRINDSTSTQRLFAEYDDVSNTSTILMSGTTSNTFVATNSGLNYIVSGDDLELFCTSDPIHLRTINTSVEIVRDTGQGSVADLVLGNSTITTKLHVANTDPNATIGSDEGAICFVRDGESSGVYVRKATAGVNSSDWVELGDVQGPSVAVDNAITTYNGTTGKSIQQVENFTAIDTGSDLDVHLTTPASNGSVSLELRDELGAEKLCLFYDDNANVSRIDMSGTGGNAFAVANSDFVMSAVSQDIFLNTVVTGAVHVTTPADSNSHMNIGRLAQSFTTPILKFEDPVDTSNWFLGDADPVGTVTGTGGDVAIRVDGANSGIYVHTGAASDNTSWVDVVGNNGDVVGPGSATDKGIVLFNGTTGKLVQSSSAIYFENIVNSALVNLETTASDGDAGVILRDSTSAIRAQFRSIEDVGRVDLFLGGVTENRFVTETTLEHRGETLPDTTALIDFTTQGTNGGTTDIHVGNRNPEGNVAADAASLYIRDDGTSSAMYFKTTDTANTGWQPFVVGPDAATANTIAVYDGTTGALLKSPTTVTVDTDNNRLGVGQTAPESALVVAGSVNHTPTQNGFHAGFALGDTDRPCIEMAGATDGIIDFALGDGTDVRGRISYTHSNDRMEFSTAGTVRGAIDGVGQLGVLTTIPTETLDVNGTARIRSLDEPAVDTQAPYVLKADSTGVIQQQVSNSGSVKITENADTSQPTFTSFTADVGQQITYVNPTIDAEVYYPETALNLHAKDNTSIYAETVTVSAVPYDDIFLENPVLGQPQFWRVRFSYSGKSSGTSISLKFKLTNPISGFVATSKIVLPNSQAADDFVTVVITAYHDINSADANETAYYSPKVPAGTGGYQLFLETNVSSSMTVVIEDVTRFNSMF